jgi:hypothetical protein
MMPELLELVNTYLPDILWSDGEAGNQVLPARHPPIVAEVFKVHITDIEVIGRPIPTGHVPAGWEVVKNARVSDPDPDPHGSALIWVAGSGSAFTLRIQIRIQEGKNDPQK